MKKVTQLGSSCCLWDRKSVLTKFRKETLKEDHLGENRWGRNIEMDLKEIGRDAIHRNLPGSGLEPITVNFRT
jgi:hypothetical protein